MTGVPPKHQQTVDEAISQLMSRAADTRGLTVDDVRPRVASALGKYLLNDNGDADRNTVKQFIDEIRADDFCLIIACEKGDADSCLRRVNQSRPDLLILDVNMSGGEPEVVRAVKRICPTMQILVFSGRSTRGVRAASLAAGAADYVVKTGRLQPLLDGLHRAADRITTR